LKFNQDALKVILGVKLKQFRRSKGLSLKELTAISGVSTSYLNEIESGKKFPKKDKISDLARALKIPTEDLLNFNLGDHMTPLITLLKSNFLSDLPLDLFGISSSSLLKTISRSPNKFSAFVSTLVQIAKTYGMQVEDFYMAALRSYREMNHDYFPKMEEKADAFLAENNLEDACPISSEELMNILIKKYRYKIESMPLDENFSLQEVRSIFKPGKPKKLFVNPSLTESQRSFIFAKEIGYNLLKCKKRPLTAKALGYTSFEEVLNDYLAGSIAEAILVPRKKLAADIEIITKGGNWDSTKFISILRKYNVHQECLFHRMSQVFYKDFGVKKLFFLRMDYDNQSNNYQIKKELHVGGLHRQHGIGLREHYCRRWVTITLLQKLTQRNQFSMDYNPILDVQRARFGQDDDYFVFAMASPSKQRNEISNCIAIGFKLTDTLIQKVPFLSSTEIPSVDVGETCERCSNMDCLERSSPPKVLRRDHHIAKIKESVDHFINP
jgi:XRE family transcriptional regulator, fatty acid utilization regulator